jgi:hypothetical protein
MWHTKKLLKKNNSKVIAIELHEYVFKGCSKAHDSKRIIIEIMTLSNELRRKVF